MQQHMIACSLDNQHSIIAYRNLCHRSCKTLECGRKTRFLVRSALRIPDIGATQYVSRITPYFSSVVSRWRFYQASPALVNFACEQFALLCAGRATAYAERGGARNLPNAPAYHQMQQCKHHRRNNNRNPFQLRPWLCQCANRNNCNANAHANQHDLQCAAAGMRRLVLWVILAQRVLTVRAVHHVAHALPRCRAVTPKRFVWQHRQANRKYGWRYAAESMLPVFMAHVNAAEIVRF